MPGSSKFIYGMFLMLCVGLFGGSCSKPFDPWQENDLYHFSINGYLDASDDTQWVRVMPVREDLFQSPEPIDVTVTLEEIQSREITVLNDSLFAYAHNRYAWNFWTTMEIQPEQSYRLTAQRSDGVISRARTTTPAEFPVPLVLIQESPRGIPERLTVVVEGVERLADVQIVYRNHTIAHIDDTVHTASGDIQVIIDLQEDVDVLNPLYPNLTPGSLIGSSARIFIAAAGPDHHHFGSFEDKVLALPEGVSNIENGVGYFAGVVSKTIPYESCKTETMEVVPCEAEPPPWKSKYGVTSDEY